MAARVAQVSLFAVALIIGLLLVGQLRSQARPIELSSLSAQELSALIETLSARNVELRDGLDDLRDQIRDYERAAVEGQSDIVISEEALLGISAFGGLVGGRGAGIVIEVEGPSTRSRSTTSSTSSATPARRRSRSTRSGSRRARWRSSGTSAIEIDGVPIGPSFEIARHRLAGRAARGDRAPGRHPQPLRAVDRRALHRPPGRSAGAPATRARPHAAAARPVE